VVLLAFQALADLIAQTLDVLDLLGLEERLVQRGDNPFPDLQDINRVAEETGTSPEMIRRNYLVPISRTFAEEWFSL